jgi:hypothetical protein
MHENKPVCQEALPFARIVHHNPHTCVILFGIADGRLAAASIM